MTLKPGELVHWNKELVTFVRGVEAEEHPDASMLLSTDSTFTVARIRRSNGEVVQVPFSELTAVP